MLEEPKFLRLTEEGRSIWSTRDTVPLPLDYRRILGLVDYCGHVAVIQSLLGRFPRREVNQWLREFEELRLIEAAVVPRVPIAEVARKAPSPPLEPEDKAFYDDVLNFADISLSRLGVYLPYERISHRPPSSKAVEHTVALVVEDDPDQLALAAHRLTSAGYRVAASAGAVEMVRYLEGNTPDAIFLDVNLPDGDGFDLLAGLRRHPLFTHLPLVMLTARTRAQDVARGLALAADGYVTKPYGRNTLDYMMRCLLKQELEVNAS